MRNVGTNISIYRICIIENHRIDLGVTFITSSWTCVHIFNQNLKIYFCSYARLATSSCIISIPKLMTTAFFVLSHVTSCWRKTFSPWNTFIDVQPIDFYVELLYQHTRLRSLIMHIEWTYFGSQIQHSNTNHDLKFYERLSDKRT